MKLCTRLGIVAAALLFAGCGATKDSGPEELIPEEDGSTQGDTDNSGTFDVALDVDPDGATGDTSCATTTAAAIKPPVDVIVVVDQSGSMSGEIANVRANINKLSDFLKSTGLSYRVVMIAGYNSSSINHNGTVYATSSTYQVCVPPPLGGATCGAPATLFRQSNVNVQSNDALKIVANTFDSTDPMVKWKDFLRAGAVKVIIPITDDNATSYYMLADGFDSALTSKPGYPFGTASKRNYVVYPIIGAAPYPDDVSMCGSGMVNNGSEYIKLAKLTKGKWFPLCATDFGPLFVDMAKSIATRVACELTIPPPPSGEKLDPNRVNVTYTPGSGGTPETVKRDDTADCYAGANGWQYNADKTKILLCGDACKKVQADLGGKVDVQFGCATITK